LAYLNIYTGPSELYSEQFNVKISEIPNTLNDFKGHLEDALDDEGYFPEDIYKKKKTANIYYFLSSFSKGPFTSDIDLVMYNKKLFPQFKHPNSGIMKVKNSPDNNILQSIMEVADPSKNKVPKQWVTQYQGQPHHRYFIPQVFKKDYVVATEVPVWIYDRKQDALIIGKIDMVVIIGKNIYIGDYKPERDLSLDPTGVDNIYADTIPQISTEALIFKQMFADEIKKGGYDVYTFTFNKDDGIVADPYKSLKMYTEFYEKVKPTEPEPPWKWVLEQYEKKWQPNP
jgi:hypothetical protein